RGHERSSTGTRSFSQGRRAGASAALLVWLLLLRPLPRLLLELADLGEELARLLACLAQRLLQLEVLAVQRSRGRVDLEQPVRLDGPAQLVQLLLQLQEHLAQRRRLLLELGVAPRQPVQGALADPRSGAALPARLLPVDDLAPVG